jgi:hypothetical protein
LDLKKWIKYIVVLISILLLAGTKLPPVIGCAGGSVEDYYFGRMTFIQSDLSRDALFKQYFFDVNAYRSEYDVDVAILNTKSTQNLREWTEFFGKRLSGSELSELVYKMPVAKLERLLKEPSPAGNKLLSVAKRPALEYLVYAKQCEPYVVASESDWDDDFVELKKRRQSEVMQKLIDQGLAGYRQVESPFLKARYAYQVIRLANYAGFYQKCLDYYEQLMAPLGQPSIVAAWAWRLQNGALRQCGAEAEALVQTSLLFDQNRYLMDEAFTDFYIPREALWKQCLRQAGSKHRQATLWLLRDLKEERFTIEPLQKMYQLEPQTSRLEMLLVRYVNRLEQEYFGSFLFFKPVDREAAEQKATALKYCRELQRLLSGADRAKVHDPVLWDCVAAYLEIVTQNYQKATAFLAKAATGRTKNDTVKKQVKLLKALKTVAQNARLTPMAEADCLPALSWLETASRQPGNNLVQIHKAFYTLLAQKYLGANNYPKAYCSLAKPGIYEEYLLDYFDPSGRELDSILQFITKKGKTPYEKVLTTGHCLSLDDLYSVKGTQLLRQENWEAAAAYFGKIPPAFWAKQKKDDYAGIIRTSFARDCYNPHTGLYNYPKQGFSIYTKLDFTRKVLQLEEAAARDFKRADQYYYQIANGFFHSPYWACNENIGEYLLLSKDLNSDYLHYWLDDAPFRDVSQTMQQWFWQQYQVVGVRKTALKYYVKAMQVTKNKEFAAHCCFLAQACMTEFSFYREFQEPGKSRFYYFDILRQKYQDTAYFQNCLKECDTLAKYLNKK